MRPFPRLSSLEREGARRIARRLLANGMDPAMVRRHMMEKRGVDMTLPEIQALSPRRVSAQDSPAPKGCRPALPPSPGGGAAVPAFGLKSGAWTRQEEAQLCQMHKDGLPPRTIAARLNRSPAAVQNRKALLGLKAGTRRKWSRAELEELRAFTAQNRPGTEIARLMGRSVSSVYVKQAQLREGSRV